MCMSTYSRTYWWPRRKSYERTIPIETLRKYSTDVAENKVYDTSQDTPFLDGFPERLIREGLPERLKRQGIRKKDLAIEDILGTSAESKTYAEPFQGPPEKEEEHIEDHSVESAQTEVGNHGEGLQEQAHDNLDMFEDLTSNARASVPNPITEQDATPAGASLQPAVQGHGTPAESPKIDEIGINEAAESVLQPVLNPVAETLPMSANPLATNIHILGAGQFGKYIAHSLAAIPHAPPVTLLLHSPALMKQWEHEGSAIGVLRDGQLALQSGINVEFSGSYEHYEQDRGHGRKPHYSPGDGIIHNLVVTTDGFATLPALAAIMHRIRPSTSICFLQDGMGIVNKVNETLFTDPRTRPHLAVGDISHKLTPTERVFTVIERETGDISVSALIETAKTRNEYSTFPRERPWVRRMDGIIGPFKYLLRTLTRSPKLNVQALPGPEFHLKRLQDLAINAAFGPLSVVYDCPSEQLLKNYHVRQTMQLHLAETSLILRSLPELQMEPKLGSHFSALRLEKILVATIRSMGAGNTTQMLQAVRAGKKTDVDFFNGYLVNRAKELGLPCPHNEMLLAVVKAKQTVSSRKDEWFIPIQDE